MYVYCLLCARAEVCAHVFAGSPSCNEAHAFSSESNAVARYSITHTHKGGESTRTAVLRITKALRQVGLLQLLLQPQPRRQWRVGWAHGTDVVNARPLAVGFSVPQEELLRVRGHLHARGRNVVSAKVLT